MVMMGILLMTLIVLMIMTVLSMIVWVALKMAGYQPKDMEECLEEKDETRV